MAAIEKSADGDARPGVAEVNPTPTPEAAIASGVDRATQASIGDLLRIYYDGLVKAPIPDRLARLWDDLERKDHDGDRDRARDNQK